MEYWSLTMRGYIRELVIPSRSSTNKSRKHCIGYVITALWNLRRSTAIELPASRGLFGMHLLGMVENVRRGRPNIIHNLRAHFFRECSFPCTPGSAKRISKSRKSDRIRGQIDVCATKPKGKKRWAWKCNAACEKDGERECGVTRSSRRNWRQCAFDW